MNPWIRKRSSEFFFSRSLTQNQLFYPLICSYEPYWTIFILQTYSSWNIFILNWCVLEKYQNFYGNPLHPLAAVQISATALQRDCGFSGILTLGKKQGSQLVLLFHCFDFEAVLFSILTVVQIIKLAIWFNSQFQWEMTGSAGKRLFWSEMELWVSFCYLFSLPVFSTKWTFLRNGKVAWSEYSRITASHPLYSSRG